MTRSTAPHSSQTTDSLQLKPGVWVLFGKRKGRIRHIPSLNEIHLEDEQGELFFAAPHQLRALEPENLSPPDPRPLDSQAHQEAVRHAEFCYEVLAPLLECGPERTNTDVKERAAEFGVGQRTLSRWLEKFEHGGMNALLRQSRQDRGKLRLDETLETLITRLIEKQYLSDDRPTMTHVYGILTQQVAALNAALPAESLPYQTPAFETFRSRIYAVQEQKRVSRRYGQKAVRAITPAFGEYPGADYPLAVVQIDHNILDVLVVDRVHREPLGRPWLTLIMDTYSRCVLGYYISMDSPSAFSSGQALSHAILPKEGWLAQNQDALAEVLKDIPQDSGSTGVRLEWPCWGKPGLVKMDNAKEFRGKLLEQTLRKYGIGREFRRVAQPWDAGGVERLFRTLNSQLKNLPGSTFSSPQERGEYDSQAKSALTLEALEVWLSAYLLGIYHHKWHDSLKMSPLKRWQQGILQGTDTTPATGMPERIGGDRAERLKLDFLPFFEGTVQRTGIQHETLTYNGDLLRRFVGSRHPDYPTRARRFRVAYDPRDISGVYFLDPDLDRYFEVRCRQPDFPAMSIWELRATRAYARREHLKASNEHEVMQVYLLMNRLISEERKTTLAVRTQAEREHGKKRVKEQKPTAAVPVLPFSNTVGALLSNLDEILPYEGIEIS